MCFSSFNKRPPGAADRDADQLPGRPHPRLRRRGAAQAFGAQIYVADLVGIAMAREMGAMMTGIIMAGRTGAAFAAQLGTMKVNQEIDALTTFGSQPMDFLVLPRMIALVLMMPLLCLYADLIGILGGAPSASACWISPGSTYIQADHERRQLDDLFGGVFKSIDLRRSGRALRLHARASNAAAAPRPSASPPPPRWSRPSSSSSWPAASSPC